MDEGFGAGNLLVGLCPEPQSPLSLGHTATIRARVPVITLWQPWASLIFAGYKRHETRAYRPPLKYVGGFVAIHAAARPCPANISDELAELCYDAFGCAWNYSLPRGAILGCVSLSGAVPTGEQAPFVTSEDLAAGDWTPGRWAWSLCDIETLPTPVPAKGKQGWWSIEADAPRPNPIA